MIEILSIKTEDNLKLDGILYTSDVNREINACDKKLVISVHGIKSKMFNERNCNFARELNKEGIDFLVFNNRGHVIVSYPQVIEGKLKLTGSTYEDFNESIYDLKAVVKFALDKGYKEIHLNGHSFGCDKIILFMNHLINASDDESKNMYELIKSIGLMSLVDFRYFKKDFSKEKIESFIKEAKEKVLSGNENELMSNEAFIIPLCAKEYLNLFSEESLVMKYANYEDEDFEFKYINEIKRKKFFAFGNNGELILDDAYKIKEKIENKINDYKEIYVFDDANHSFTGYETELALKYTNFVKNI